MCESSGMKIILALSFNGRSVYGVQLYLVKSLHGSKPMGGRGAAKPFDPRRRIRTPDLARDVVVEARREGLERALNFCALGWN